MQQTYIYTDKPINPKSSWNVVDNFQEKNQKVEYEGHQYSMIAKYEDQRSKIFIVARILLRVVAVIFSLGFALLSENVRELFNSKKTYINAVKIPDPIQNPSMAVGKDDYVIFKENKPKIPKREFCQQALNMIGIDAVIEPENKGDIEGGNGVFSFTTDRKYAVKRSTNLNANDPNQNEIIALNKAASKIQSSNPKGFNFNLPEAVFTIVDKSGKTQDCNIQIFPKVSTLNESPEWGHLHLRDFGDVIRRYFSSKDEICLKIIFSLGKKLAEFQQSQEVKFDKERNYHIGLQHGDFNAGNILITGLDAASNAEFTLVDNVDFRPDGRLVADPIYFIYFNTICIPGLSADFEEHKSSMTEIVDSFYTGYVSNLKEEIRTEMDKVFTSQIPLAESVSGKEVYSKEVLNATGNLWGELLDGMQKRAYQRVMRMAQQTV